MVHIFDHEKGRFVQVHHFTIPPRASRRVSKRNRNAEYVKGLVQATLAPKAFPAAESLQQMGLASVQPAEKAEEKKAAAEEEKARKQKAAEEEKRRQEEKAAERKRKQEEELEKKRQKEEEEQRRKAEAAEQKKQKEAAESERKRQEKEEAERKKKEADEAARKKKEEEQAARKRKEEEEAAQKKKEEEEAVQKKKEEEAAARKKKEEEEAARKKEEEEKAAQKKAEEEEAAQKKKEEEEAAQKKKEEEEEAARKKEEEEAVRKGKEEEEKAAQKKKEEEVAAQKKKEEEEAAQKKKEAEEEAARKKKEEEEEAARKKKEEEEAEAARKKEEEEEAARKKKEEKEAARKKKEEEEEAARKKKEEEEEAARKKKEEEEEEAERKRVEAEEAEERRVEAAKNAAEDALADAAGGSDIPALQEALEKAEAAGVDPDSLEEARQRLTELEEEKERKQRQSEEHDEAEDALATAAGGDDIKALESAIQRAEAAGCGKGVVEEAYERLLELKEDAAAAAAEKVAEEAAEDEEEQEWEKSGADGQAKEEEEAEEEPVEAPKISSAAYRAFEADGGSKMSASAPEFIPNQHSWTVNLAKTNPAAVKARRAAAPEISAASKRMPTYEKKDWILATLRRNTVTVISGDTGCGKSTLIPQLICDAENLIPEDKVIVCTQPRRIAAITLAQYVAADRKQELGDEVGYQIRFVNAFSEHTRLVYATTAIILRRLHSEPTLDSIGCLIVDEVHERDVYTDFVLLLLREAMLAGRMPHLKIVLMSATLKAEDFANYFKEVNGGADALKPIHIPGRMYAVEDYYWEDACEWLKFCPPLPRAGGGKGKKGGGSDDRQKPDDSSLWKIYDLIKACDIAKGRPGEDRVNDYGEKALTACFCWKENEVYIDLICNLVYYFHKEEPKGDGAILIFLPGWGDISKVFLELYASGESFKLIALHSLMTPEQQQEAFEPAPRGKRKVVLSTNIAEASVTINDVVYVIDCGVRKERAYNPETGVSSLDAKMVTKANAIQRRGRAGRVQEGLVVHLFPSYKMSKFEEFPLPQMLTSSMDEVVLQSKVICGTANEDIAKMLMGSMAAPAKESITGAVSMLRSMDCLTKEGELTALGRACASIPVQPNVAKMLLMAGAFRCIKPAAVVAAFLSVKNPFQQSPGQPKGGGKSSDKDKKKTGKEYFNKGFCSDHLTCLQAYVEWRRAVKGGKGDDFCEEQGLSPETMDMAHMMAQQFTNFMMEANYDGSDVREEDIAPVRRGSEEDALLKCALAAGFAPNFVLLYKGNRSPYWWLDSNQEVYPFPGSVNRDHIMMGKDGEEWMVYSDSMVMGRGHSIMDSSLVFSPMVLLFAKAILIDEKKGEIRFDRWWAQVNASDSQLKEIMELRSVVLSKFKDTIEGRDLSVFPKELTHRMAEACMRTPIALNKIEPCPQAIDDEATGQARKRLSVYEWPVDEGREEDDDQ